MTKYKIKNPNNIFVRDNISLTTGMTYLARQMMVRIYILTFLLLLANFAIGQTVDSMETKMITFIEEAPLFNGDINDFIQSKINYPEGAITDSIEGVVYVSFWIDNTGETINHEVIRGIRKDLNLEALRVAKLIRFEKPALQKGKPIEVKYTVPVRFSLDILKSRKIKSR